MKYLIATILIGIISLLGYYTLSVGAGITDITKDKIIASEITGDVVNYKYYTNEVIAEKGEDLKMRTANAKFFPQSTTTIAKIYPSEQFYKTKDKWYQVEYATTTKTEFDIINKVSFFEKLLGKKVWADTFYSGVGDGHVYKDDNTNWTITHDAAVGSTANYTATTTTVETRQKAISGEFVIYRLFLPFNTSAIPSDATILSANLNIYVTSVYDSLNDGADVIYTVQTSQANSALLTTADYNEAGATTTPTVGDDEGNDISNITISTNLTIDLNSTGISWIKKSGEASTCGTTAGYTCLGIREGHDIISSENDNAVGNIVTISTSEETGTTQDPYLLITYTTPYPTGDLQIKSGTLQIKSGTLQIKS